MPSVSQKGELTQVEVRGLRRDGEGRGLGKHLTTNCGCRTDWAAVHLLKGLTVAVHVSLEKIQEKKYTFQCGKKKNGKNMLENVSFLPPWVVLQDSWLWRWQTQEKHSERGSEQGRQERVRPQDRSDIDPHWWCDGEAELQAHPGKPYGPGHLRRHPR